MYPLKLSFLVLLSDPILVDFSLSMDMAILSMDLGSLSGLILFVDLNPFEKSNSPVPAPVRPRLAGLV